ncbi:MAG: hypothetical protein P8141_11225 [Gammaproteobacteria bacterium]
MSAALAGSGNGQWLCGRACPIGGQPQYDAGDGSQDHIADLISEVIVYLFEIIQIDEGNVQRPILVRRLD